MEKYRHVLPENVTVVNFKSLRETRKNKRKWISSWWFQRQIWIISPGIGVKIKHTLPETNIFAPENQCLEDYFPFGITYFQVLC